MSRQSRQIRKLDQYTKKLVKLGLLFNYNYNKQKSN